MLKDINIENFRNFNNAELHFAPNLNIILGQNGVGKSNLLEAAYLCGLGKTFRGHNQVLVRIDQQFAKIAADSEDRNEVEIVLLPGGERNITFNDKKVPRISQLLGKFPMTYIGPEEVMLVAGAPSLRRAILDTHLCQFDTEYVSHLSHYQRSIRQRNAALRGVASHTMAGGMVLIDSWDEKVAKSGSAVTATRIDFLQKLSPIATEIFSAIAGEGIFALNMKYRSTALENPDVSDFENKFYEKLAQRRKLDLIRFDTSIGPHRDDIEIHLGNFDARHFASWGQIRMISLAMYLASVKILSEHTQHTPTILLDDALAELDPVRSRAALDFFPQIGQALVATPHPEQVRDITGAKHFIFSAPGVVLEKT